MKNSGFIMKEKKKIEEKCNLNLPYVPNKQ
jgi:hypothetical protein